MILQILTAAALVQFVAFLVVTARRKRKYAALHKKTIYRFNVDTTENIREYVTEGAFTTMPLPVEEKEVIQLV